MKKKFAYFAVVYSLNEKNKRTFSMNEEKKFNSQFSFRARKKRAKVVSHNCKFAQVQIIANEQCALQNVCDVK